MEVKDYADYCLNRLMLLEKENAELKEKLAKCDKENSAMTRSSSLYYSVKWYDWNVKKGNYKDYKRAVDNKDFDWLYRHDLSIDSHLVDFEFMFDGKKYLFVAESSRDGTISLVPLSLDNDDYFENYDEAKKNALERVMREVERCENQVKKEEEAAQAQQAS